ncbi:MAG: sigma 54-interacting transcriptional regulator, partial [Halocynthiibacter sp.]
LPLVGRSPQMQALYRLVARVMNTDLPVLISGESGSGKSLIARAIHDFSDRRALPFVVVDAAKLEQISGPSQILAEVGAGTLLFDEVADLGSEAQTRAVRMLDNLPENAPRVMASSQPGLEDRLARDQFRADLFYRLSGVTVQVPPLRERVEDIALLVEHFLVRSERGGAPLRRFSDAAMAQVRRYRWPGNVRQLENTVCGLAVTGGGDEISQSEVDAVLGGQPATEPSGFPGERELLATSVARHLRRYFELHGGELPPPGLYQRILREIELPLIELALDVTGGNQARCADLLGINRNTLRKKITELDIRVTRRRKLM